MEKTTQFMGHQLQWQREPVSGVQMFEVMSGYPADAQRLINRTLNNRLWDGINDYYQCASGATRSSGYDFEQTVTPHLLTQQIVSTSVFTSYYCGGEHPDFGDDPINLDVTSGKTLQLEDILWLGKGTPPHEDTAGETVLWAYREQQLAPWLAKTFSKLYPQQIADSDCEYSDTAVWKFPSWYLTPKGLYLGPSFARAARVCEYPDWSVLPYELLGQHRGPSKIKLP